MSIDIKNLMCVDLVNLLYGKAKTFDICQEFG
jgi:hypothetical protein